MEKFRGVIYERRAEELREMLKEIDIDLARIPLADRDSAARWNQNALQAISDIPVPEKAGRVPAITSEQAWKIYGNVANHPVASLSMMRKYDPEDSFGFCFGRAMAVHLEALALGIDKGSIRKIWAAGDLGNGYGGKWAYHVATIIRATDGDWWAIDPIMGRPMKVEKWFETMRDDYDGSKTMQIYTTPPSRFSRLPGKYIHNEKEYWDEIRKYVADLVQSFKNRKPQSFLPPS